jgi:hypothetical protein
MVPADRSLMAFDEPADDPLDGMSDEFARVLERAVDRPALHHLVRWHLGGVSGLADVRHDLLEGAHPSPLRLP